jgi:hypothetical protein
MIIRIEVVDAPPYAEPAQRTGILDNPKVRLRMALAALRRLDAEVKRLVEEDIHDGFESPQDEIAEKANDQARAALQLALTMLGMAQAS